VTSFQYVTSFTSFRSTMCHSVTLQAHSSLDTRL